MNGQTWDILSYLSLVDLSAGTYKLPDYGNGRNKPRLVYRCDRYCVNSSLLDVYGRCSQMLVKGRVVGARFGVVKFGV